MRKLLTIYDTYQIECDNRISKGNYADVFLAKLFKREKKTKYRLLDRFICSAGGGGDYDELIIKITDSDPEKLDNEINCLLELKDEPHIIHIKYTDNGFAYKIHKFIGLERCKGGDLFDYISKHGKCTESKAKKILVQIVAAIEECHKHGIVHGDIKLENIGLLYKNDITELKLLDFGCAYKIKHPNDESEHKFSEFYILPSPHYAPPEFLSDTIKVKERDLIYADLWELGVLCYILLTGKYPFGWSGSNVETIKHFVSINRLEWPSKIPISNEMKQFVEHLLKSAPTQRKLDLHVLVA